MKFKSLNESVEAELPKSLENFISKREGKIREFKVKKYIGKNGDEKRRVYIDIYFGNDVSLESNFEPLSDKDEFELELSIPGWGSAGSFSDPKRIDEVSRKVQDTVNTVRDALEVFQYIKGFKFEDLMIVK
jgi:hypothetical protein